MSDKEETNNYHRLNTLVVKTGTRTLREVLNKYTDHDIATALKANSQKILKMRKGSKKNDDLFFKRGTLNEPQFNLVIADTPDVEKFDITLLVILIQNLCPRVNPPVTGWTSPVSRSDTTIGGYIIRIRTVRNDVQHAPNTRVSNDFFKDFWAEAETCLIKLAADVNILDEIAEEIKNSMTVTVYSNNSEAKLSKSREEEIFNEQAQPNETNENYISEGNIESENYYRLITLLVKTGTRTFRDVFKKYTGDYIASVHRNHIDNMKHKRVLTNPQHQLLTTNTPNLEKFDISLLVILIRNICTKVEAPLGGWETACVLPSDTTVGGNIIRIRNIRNDVVCDSSDTRVSNDVFKKKWTEAEKCLRELADHVGNLDEITEEIKNTESMPLTVYSNINLEAMLKTCGEDELYAELVQLNNKADEYSTYLKTVMKKVSIIRTQKEGDQHTGSSGSANQQTAPVVNNYILLANTAMNSTKDVIDNKYAGVSKAFGIYTTQQQQTKALPPIVNPNALVEEANVKVSKKLDVKKRKPSPETTKKNEEIDSDVPQAIPLFESRNLTGKAIEQQQQQQQPDVKKRKPNPETTKKNEEIDSDVAQAIPLFESRNLTGKAIEQQQQQQPGTSSEDYREPD